MQREDRVARALGKGSTGDGDCRQVIVRTTHAKTIVPDGRRLDRSAQHQSSRLGQREQERLRALVDVVVEQANTHECLSLAGRKRHHSIQGLEVRPRGRCASNRPHPRADRHIALAIQHQVVRDNASSLVQDQVRGHDAQHRQRIVVHDDAFGQHRRRLTDDLRTDRDRLTGLMDHITHRLDANIEAGDADRHAHHRTHHHRERLPVIEADQHPGSIHAERGRPTLHAEQNIHRSRRRVAQANAKVQRLTLHGGRASHGNHARRIAVGSTITRAVIDNRHRRRRDLDQRIHRVVQLDTERLHPLKHRIVQDGDHDRLARLARRERDDARNMRVVLAADSSAVGRGVLHRNRKGRRRRQRDLKRGNACLFVENRLNGRDFQHGSSVVIDDASSNQAGGLRQQCLAAHQLGGQLELLSVFVQLIIDDRNPDISRNNTWLQLNQAIGNRRPVLTIGAELHLRQEITRDLRRPAQQAQANLDGTGVVRRQGDREKRITGALDNIAPADVNNNLVVTTRNSCRRHIRQRRMPQENVLVRRHRLFDPRHVQMLTRHSDRARKILRLDGRTLGRRRPHFENTSQRDMEHTHRMTRLDHHDPILLREDHHPLPDHIADEQRLQLSAINPEGAAPNTSHHPLRQAMRYIASVQLEFCFCGFGGRVATMLFHARP